MILWGNAEDNSRRLIRHVVVAVGDTLRSKEAIMLMQFKPTASIRQADIDSPLGDDSHFVTRMCFRV